MSELPRSTHFNVQAFLQRRRYRPTLDEKLIAFFGVLSGARDVQEERFQHYIPLIEECIGKKHLILIQQPDPLGQMVGEFLSKRGYGNVVVFVSKDDLNVEDVGITAQKMGWDVVSGFNSKEECDMGLLAVADSMACLLFNELIENRSFQLAMQFIEFRLREKIPNAVTPLTMSMYKGLRREKSSKVRESVMSFETSAVTVDEIREKFAIEQLLASLFQGSVPGTPYESLFPEQQQNSE